MAFEVVDPDRSSTLYAGEETPDGRYRPYQTWVDLAEVLGCAFCTPRLCANGFVQLRFRKLDRHHSWHQGARASGDPEKYGAASPYARIHRTEEPHFLTDFHRSLRRMQLSPTGRVLSLGVNQGDELQALTDCIDTERMQVFGIDHAASAIAQARDRFPDFSFAVHDLRTGVPPGRYDLILAINVLHSPTLDGQGVFRALVQHHLTARGGLILGFPNGRYRDHRLRYGAQTRHHDFPELSVLLRGVAYYRRYLQRRGFVVTLTGKYTLLVTASRPNRAIEEPPHG